MNKVEFNRTIRPNFKKRYGNFMNSPDSSSNPIP